MLDEKNMTNRELIALAVSLVKARKTKNGLFGDVACALISADGKVYKGACAASGSNVSCAEQNAIGAMMTDAVYRIAKIVAVWKDENGAVFVISPCGICRQLMREIDEENLMRTEVVLDHDRSVPLEELLPYHSWWKKQEYGI